MIGAFPKAGFILAGHGGMIGPDAPIPFFAHRRQEIFFDKVPAVERAVVPGLVAADLPGVKEAYHGLCLRPPMFFPDEGVCFPREEILFLSGQVFRCDDAAIVPFVPEAAVVVQSF